MRHGIYINEETTTLNAITQVDNGIVVAVGVAPRPSEKPIIAYNLTEAVSSLGYSEEYDKYTLCEVMATQFSLYNSAPAIFINVLDYGKHYKAREIEIEGANTYRLSGEIDSSTIKVTTGRFEEPTKLTASDYEIEEIEADDSDSDNVIEAATKLKITNGDAIIDNKIQVTYRLKHEALGGREYTTEITLSNALFYDLPTDTLVSSVVVKTGGINTLTDLDYEYEAGIVTVEAARILENKIKISWHEIKPELVTSADIIGGVDLATGKASGIALIDSIYPSYNIGGNLTLISPKYSLDETVAGALSAKAKAVSGLFPAIAVVDLSTANKTYTQAVEAKNRSNLSDSHLIVCYPKVRSGGKQYYLSSHVAALMNVVDAANDGIPYVSPSNQTLQIETAVLDDGTEQYLTQEQANLLNSAGIVTVLSLYGLKSWGNRTSKYPASNDPREVFISVRRMFNFITANLIRNYLSNLDVPINRKMIDSIISSVNIWLSSLTARGVILGGEVEFNEADNPVTNLMDGALTFRLRFTPPVPAESLNFTLQYDSGYLTSLF